MGGRAGLRRGAREGRPKRAACRDGSTRACRDAPPVARRYVDYYSPTVPRALVLVPDPAKRLVGAQPIGRGYTKEYTAPEMRAWGSALARLYQTPTAQLAELRGADTQMLRPNDRAVVEAHKHLFEESERGIAGTLREDGRIELDRGRHRVTYMLDQGVEPIPVWVLPGISGPLIVCCGIVIERLRSGGDKPGAKGHRAGLGRSRYVKLGGRSRWGGAR